MPLSSKEFRNRVLAGAALHGLGMRSLRTALEEFGADRTLAEAMIRDETARKLRRNLRDLSETLEVPEAWFTEQDWRPLIRDDRVDEPWRRRLTAPPADGKGDEKPEDLIPPEDQPGESEDVGD